MARKLQSQSMRWHRFVGLNLALYFMVMFLTGAILVLRTEINTAFQPIPSVASTQSPLPAHKIYRSVSSHYDQVAIFSIAFPEDQSSPYTANIFVPGKGRLTAAISPIDGAVLAEITRNPVTQFIRDLHASLLIPTKIGFLLVSSTSVLLLFSVVSGMISYRRFWRGLARRPSPDAPDQARWGGWHRLAGVWSIPFLLTIALTGLYFFAKDLGVAGSLPPAPAVAERQSPLPDNFVDQQLPQALALANISHPDFVLQSIDFPTKANEPLKLKGFQGAKGIFTAQRIYFDPGSLQVIGSEMAKDGSGLMTIAPLLVALHFGAWGGTFGKVLWVTFAALSLALMVAGMQVAVARTSNDDTRSKIRQFWSELGHFRWLYLAAAAGIAFITVAKYLL